VLLALHFPSVWRAKAELASTYTEPWCPDKEQARWVLNKDISCEGEYKQDKGDKGDKQGEQDKQDQHCSPTRPADAC
jgi:hypothetical protein